MISTLRKVGTCTVFAPTGVRYVFPSRVGWTSGMCLRIDRARRLIVKADLADARNTLHAITEGTLT